MSPQQTPPLDRRDMYKDRQRVTSGPDSSRYSSSSSYSSRRPHSGYYRNNYQEDSGSRGGTPSRSDRFYYEDHHQNHHHHSNYHRGYAGGNSGRYERGGRSNRSVRYDPYHNHHHNHQYQRRSSPNYEPYHHHVDYQRRSSPNYEPYHHQHQHQHEGYPTEHSTHRYHQTGNNNLRSVPIGSSRLSSDEYYYNRRQSSERERRSDWERERERQSSERERRSDWERERERQSSERRSDWERDRDRDRKRDEGPGRWARSGRENPEFKNQDLENPGKRIPDFKNQESEDIPMKKARLGWGQGLAKYEKQKVGYPIESSNPKGSFGNNTNNSKGEFEREKEREDEDLENGEIRCEEKEEVMCQSVIGREEEDIIAREEVILVTENAEKSSSKTEDKEIGEIIETEPKEIGEILEIPILPLPKSDIVSLPKSDILPLPKSDILPLPKSDILPLLPKSDILPLNKLDVLPLTKLDISEGNSNFALASLDQLGELKEEISKQLEITETDIDLLETELKSLENNNNNNINDNNVIIPDPEVAIINNDILKPDLEERESKNEINQLEKISIDYDIKTLLNAQENPNLIPEILTSNSELSNKANSIFTPGLINSQNQFEILINSIKSQNEKEMRIKERIKAQKKEVRLKEMILARKFRIYRRIWNEEVKLIPDKKSRKSNYRERNNVNRNRYFSSTGNLTSLGTKKAFDFSRKLMSSSQSPSKLYRPYLKMPCLILSETERNNSKFLSSNGLVFDPVAESKSNSKSNPWTESEKETFIKMLCKFGKDFTKISSFLEEKITADCVEFYYKNHKSIWFCEKMKEFNIENVDNNEKLKNKEEKKEESKTLVTGPSSDYLGKKNNSNRKRKREINTVSVENVPKNNSRSSNTNLNRKKKASTDLPVQVKIKSNASEFRKRVNSSKKTKNADLAVSFLPKPNPNSSSSPDLAKSDGLSSCITNVINYPNPNFDENNFEYCSDDGWREVESNEWSEEEKKLFVKGLAIFGKDFVKISASVGTRSIDQCKIFFSKSWKCLSLEAGFPVNGNPVIGNPVIGNTVVGNTGIGNPDLKGISSSEVEREEKGDVKIFGKIIACQNEKNEEIKDAINSVLKEGNENEGNKEGGIENMPNLKCDEEKIE